MGRGDLLDRRVSRRRRKSLHLHAPNWAVADSTPCNVQLGAYLIDSPLGRRWALAGSTFVTAFFCCVFVVVEQPWAVRASTMGISLSATVRPVLHCLHREQG